MFEQVVEEFKNQTANRFSNLEIQNRRIENNCVFKIRLNGFKLGLLHYEIFKKPEGIFFELHFEDKENNKLFSECINVGNANLNKFAWFDAESIRHNDFIIDDVTEHAAERLITMLEYMEETIGGEVRGIATRIKNKELPNIANLNTDDKARTDKIPLNTILYGPPGTGKTYNSINKAISIINPKFDLTKERKDVKAEFDRLVEKGQIVFTTFHQSMSYEDFIEGIKPQNPEDSNTISYDIEPGIFKKLCDYKPSINDNVSDIDWDMPKYYKMSLGGKNNLDIHEWCIQNSVIALGWGNDKNFSEYVNIKVPEEFRKKFIAEFGELVKESKYNIQAAYTFLSMRENDVVIISKGNHIIDAIGIVKGEYYWDDQTPIDYFQFRKVEWLATNLNTLPERFVKKNVSQMSIYEFNIDDVKKEQFAELTSKGESRVEENRRVLIIDEINRGNVSQIFGELITLIEEDKRIGGDEALEVILPYSKKPFGVPDNLYIVGTMNTADRSVEALDAALRRRFSFEEMQPKPELLSPGYMFWSLLWKYKDKTWEDAEYKKEEKELLNFLGARESIWETRKAKWDMFKQIGKRVEQANEFSNKEFDGVNLMNLLETINKRIERLLDKDHAIGHSYLISVRSSKDLQDAFYNKIIPLLQEYFFGDYGKIGLVLGKGFVRKSEWTKRGNLFADFDHESISDFEERDMFEMIDYRNLVDSYIIKVKETNVDMNFKKAVNLLMREGVD